jgi:CheY-like chemotaxis protein
MDASRNGQDTTISTVALSSSRSRFSETYTSPFHKSTSFLDSSKSITNHSAISERSVGDEENEIVNKTLLVVDDSPMNRKMLYKLLTREGYKCEEAEDGLEAVWRVQSKLKERGIHDTKGNCVAISHVSSCMYAAILMDFMMPNMDGPTATRKIRKLGFSGPIIGVTGNALPSDQSAFLDAGASRILIKPVTIDSINQCLEGIILSKNLLNRIIQSYIHTVFIGNFSLG